MAAEGEAVMADQIMTAPGGNGAQASGGGGPNDTDAEIVATCEAAVTRLTERGWGTGSYQDKDGRACLAGAIALSQVGAERWITGGGDLVDALECLAVVAVAETIAKRESLDPWAAHPERAAGTIVNFNDAEGRTDDEVIEVLNETIKRHTNETIGGAA